MSELEQKILREISKTGFPLELRTASFLEAQGYTANHGLHYIDRDERKPREIDLRCSKALKYPVAMGGRKSSFVRHTFLVECKKSEKPWVIFTSDHGSGHDQNPFEIEIEGLQLAEWTQEEVFDACEEFESIHPLFKPRRLGRSLFEPFKQRQTGESIYSAILSASKATVAARSQSFPSFAASRSPDLGFYYPVVIFEGRLFEAHLDRNEISVEEVDSIMYSLLSIRQLFAPYYCSDRDGGRLRAILRTVRSSASLLGRIAKKTPRSIRVRGCLACTGLLVNFAQPKRSNERMAGAIAHRRDVVPILQPLLENLKKATI